MLAAGLVVAGCSGRVNLEIPQELLNADTEEALLLGLSQSDGCSLEGSWKYVSEKDPEYWGYIIIEVVLNRVRGTIEHHYPRAWFEHRTRLVFRGIINPDGLSATVSTVGYYYTRPEQPATTSPAERHGLRHNCN